MIIRYRMANGAVPTPVGTVDRLAALEAAEGVRGLLAAYATSVDRQDVDRIDSLLSREVTLSVADIQLTGRESVVGFYRDAFRADPAPKTHFITNVATRWLGDGLIEADSYFLWTASEEQRSVIGWGTYHVRARVADGHAQFERIDIEIRHAGDIGEGWTRSTGQ